ncbi:MAG: alkane 1-monooxygenase, partial [Rhizobiaceae bacterium]
NGERIEYRDGKRYLWLLSVLSPAMPLIAVLLLAYTGSTWFALMPIAIYFGLVPLMDWLIGEDENNPPEQVIEQLSEDQFYRILLFASVPVFYASFIASMWAIGSLNLPIWAAIALTIGAGAASGSGITVGHELGHKPNALDQLGAKLVNAVTGYAHFCIEHNRGHHTMVATPDDPASARLGENVYRFAWRELPGTAVRGWHMERERLAKKGYGYWTWRNDILQGYSITLVIAAVLVSTFGLFLLPFILLHHLIGWLQLTFANYIEHYGLMRSKRENGKFEPCQPHHSWNTNHIASNLMLFHLQRHSDHHANPLRPYQSLRNFSELPRLPSGYPGCYKLALVPPLWFAVMDKKVLAWAGGDVGKTNLDPKNAAYYLKAK